MMIEKPKGVIIGGSFNDLVAREGVGEEPFEIGELVISEDPERGDKFLLQVYELEYGSQLSKQNLELISGLELTDTEGSLEFLDPEVRNYTLARLKPLIKINKERVGANTKSLPPFFSKIRGVKEDDLSFITKPKNPFFLGNLRSGSKELPIRAFINGRDAISHHILIPATTGRGKSNLLKVILWNLAYEDYAGILVLDPHDEYYKGVMEDHPLRKEKVVRFSLNPSPGDGFLRINLSLLRPEHFRGSLDLSAPQQDALSAYYKQYGAEFIEAIISERPLKLSFNEGTLGVLKRKIAQLMKLSYDAGDSKVVSHGVFSTSGGESIISDVCQAIEDRKIVIIDTSSFDGREEILIGTLFTSEIFRRYKSYRINGSLGKKPVVGVVLEEAPRVLGKEVLESGPNIFSTIAREGRKFNVGLIAITQLPSLIPRQVLANMNTKIILGIEMKPERVAVIESAAQDLSKDDRAIASLDKGEAIVSSNFARFALPIRIPLFDDVKKESLRNNDEAAGGVGGRSESVIVKKKMIGF